MSYETSWLRDSAPPQIAREPDIYRTTVLTPSGLLKDIHDVTAGGWVTLVKTTINGATF